jgi:hypothetical protein
MYEQEYVFTYLNEPPYGNWTFTRKPTVPMQINETQIQVGANWTYVYTLVANHTYRVFCYGDWIDDGPMPKTDYDIYVYNPAGMLESYHTEAAGLPEHLGTTIDEPLFTPKYSGNYSFVVRNDPRESQAAAPATFMVIEHTETNVWCNRVIQGKNDALSVENTSWAYGFTTASERVEIQIQVPTTLDMYEARLYLMANPSNKKGEILSGIPLAWEPGLYGETSGHYGGYTLHSQGFRGNAYASCEYFGQDMLINYTAPYSGESLYYFVLIGEAGTGQVEFRIKTDFGNSILKLASPLQKVYPGNETPINVISTNSTLHRAFLYYSTDGWETNATTEMLVSHRTCNATIPGQEAGVTVDYTVEAFDFLDNLIRINGSYPVKYATSINLTLSQEAVTLGSNLSIQGSVSPAIGVENSRVKLLFTAPNGTTIAQYRYLQTGNFSTSFCPPFLSSWDVQAEFFGDHVRYESASDVLSFLVVEPPFLVKYSIYIYAAVGVVFGAIIVLMVIRRRQ